MKPPSRPLRLLRPLRPPHVPLAPQLLVTLALTMFFTQQPGNMGQSQQKPSYQAYTYLYCID